MVKKSDESKKPIIWGCFHRPRRETDAEDASPHPCGGLFASINQVEPSLKKMKKYLLISGLSIILLGITPIAFATSGACSYHGGIDCSAGSGPLGNAICKDGTESSTNYYDAQECSVNRSYCVAPLRNYCTSASDYAAHCGQPSQYTYDMYNACHADCESQINKYQSDLANYNICLSQQPGQGTSIPTQSVQQMIQQEQARQKASDLQLQEAENRLKQSQAQLNQLNLDKSCGDSLATYNQAQSKCECESDFTYTNGKCVFDQDKFDQISNEVMTEVNKKYGSSTTTTTLTPTPVDYGSPAANELLGGKDTSSSPEPVKDKLDFSALKTITPSSTPSTIPTTTVISTQPKNVGFVYRVYQFIRSLFN